MSDSLPLRRGTGSPTPARLSLGRAGPVVPTREQLHFQLDHALARDAVHTPLDGAALVRGLRARGLEPLELSSQAAAAAGDTGARHTYLRRPDLGRRLDRDAALAARAFAGRRGDAGGDAGEGEGVLFLLADGLSALAVERHALPLLDEALARVPGAMPVVPVLRQARVALADEVGELLGAAMTVLLIGERPGLSSPDSLGVYLTWAPRPGRSDAERNCLSNIRGEAGLGYAEAAERIAYYVAEARRLQTTGIALKDPETAPKLGG